MRKFKTIKIPDSVTRIGQFAFSHCKNLTSVTLGNHVTKIHNKAFFDCDRLTSIVIPKSVISINECAFGYYVNLDKFEIEKVPNFKIYCFKDTVGEKYAIENGFDYELIDKK